MATSLPVFVLKGRQIYGRRGYLKCLHIIRKGGEAGIVVAFVYMRVLTYVHVYLEQVL
jgi:hypothetical protein